MPLRDESKYLIKVDGEPQEVTEIREKILTSFNELEFVEEGHKYFLKGQELSSVSVFAHQFEEEFNAEEKAIAYAEKHGETPEYWLDQWRFNNLKATVKGTQCHSFGESMSWIKMGHPENIVSDQIYKYVEDKGWLIPTRPQEISVLKFWEEFPFDTMHIVLPETRVYTDIDKYSTNYAGTFDLLCYFKHPIDDSKSGLMLLDWKGLPLDTDIPTENGWKKLDKIKEGDVIFDKNGKKTKVVHVSNVHYNPCYKITFDNNDEIIADCDHRWEISFKHVYKKSFKQKVMTTKEIFDYLNDLKIRHSYKLPKILLSKPIDVEEKQLPIDPYVFGVWLGDGHKVDGKVTNMYDELWTEIENRGYKIGKDLSQGGAGKAKTRTVFGLEHELKQLGLIKNKHIPDIFLFSSYNQRLDILRGFMDTDGYYNKKRKRFVMTTTQEWQADAMCMLLSSLGVRATKIKCKGRCNNCKKLKENKNGYFDKFDVTFTCDFNPFLIRKIKFEKPLTDNSSYRSIKKVEIVDTVPTKCLEVDSETHTFLCGKNFLVTHNTNADIYKQYSRDKNKMMYQPFLDLYQEPFGTYTVQLNCYQIPLEDMGLKVIGRRIIWLKEDETYQIIPVNNVTEKIRNFIK